MISTGFSYVDLIIAYLVLEMGDLFNDKILLSKKPITPTHKIIQKSYQRR